MHPEDCQCSHHMAMAAVITAEADALGVLQIQVVAATGRRHLLRKEYGLTSAVAISASPPVEHTPMPGGQLLQMQLAWASEMRNVRHRRLQQTCTPAVSAATFGDINYDCQFTFVQVTTPSMFNQHVPASQNGKHHDWRDRYCHIIERTCRSYSAATERFWCSCGQQQCDPYSEEVVTTDKPACSVAH